MIKSALFQEPAIAAKSDVIRRITRESDRALSDDFIDQADEKWKAQMHHQRYEPKLPVTVEAAPIA